MKILTKMSGENLAMSKICEIMRIFAKKVSSICSRYFREKRKLDVRETSKNAKFFQSNFGAFFLKKTFLPRK
jgi:hypothetical protein